MAIHGDLRRGVGLETEKFSPSALIWPKIKVILAVSFPSSLDVAECSRDQMLKA